MHMLHLYSRFYHESEKETIVSSIIKIINYFLSETMSTGKGGWEKGLVLCWGFYYNRWKAIIKYKKYSIAVNWKEMEIIKYGYYKEVTGRAEY